jgi:hypothetical protein
MIVVIIIKLTGDSMCHQAVSTLDIFSRFNAIAGLSWFEVSGLLVSFGQTG